MTVILNLPLFGLSEHMANIVDDEDKKKGSEKNNLRQENEELFRPRMPEMIGVE